MFWHYGCVAFPPVNPAPIFTMIYFPSPWFLIIFSQSSHDFPQNHPEAIVHHPLSKIKRNPKCWWAPVSTKFPAPNFSMISTLKSSNLGHFPAGAAPVEALERARARARAAGQAEAAEELGLGPNVRCPGVLFLLGGSQKRKL